MQILNRIDYNERQKYYKLTELKKIGFSPKIIDKYFSEPILVENPIYKNASPMKLYLKEEVDKFMLTDEYQVMIKNHNKKSEISKAFANNRRLITHDIVTKMIDKIVIPVRNIVDLKNAAINAKNDWYEANEQYDRFVNEADEKTIARWVVNYIRHQLTNYDHNLQVIKGKFGESKEYQRYSDAINDKIKSTYPELFTFDEQD